MLALKMKLRLILIILRQRRLREIGFIARVIVLGEILKFSDSQILKRVP